MAQTEPARKAPESYSPGEEIANSVTHGIGVALAIAALSILVTLAGLYGDAWRVVSFSIYGATLILLYLASTLYHAFRSPRLKRFFKGLDHAAIFLLIAGTYTPFTLVTLRGPWGWTLFGLIWGFALAGIIFETLYLGRFKRLVVGFYIVMGWLVVIAIKPLLDALPVPGMVWLAAGGISYTFGVTFYSWKRLPFNHAIWHLFVLGGSVCHFFAILFYVLPM
jgi:hemolysin III